MSIDFGQSLSGESRLIFPGQAAAARQDRRGDDVSLSSIRPLPDKARDQPVGSSVSKYLPARASRQRASSAEVRQPYP
eukprot:scaffold650435_cov50-Prasinocladus_malaysianus.AAC.1